MANSNYITSIIHRNNHYRPYYRAVIGCEDSIIDYKEIVLNKTPHVYRDINPGIYKVIVDDKDYYIDIYNGINTGGQRLTVYNINDIVYKTMSRTYPMHLYEYTGEGLYVGNSINASLDLISIVGSTDHITPGRNLNGPVEFKSITNFTIITSNHKEENILQIDLQHDLCSLPNGLKDILVLDSEHQRAYILKKINSTVVSGYDENITKLEALNNDDCTVFFIENKNAKFGDDRLNLLSNYLNTVNYTTIISKEYSGNAIALSDGFTWDHQGFYIKLRNEFATSEDAFRNLLNRWYKECPLKIMFPAVEVSYVPVLMDEYYVKTYFGGTSVEILEGYDLTFFYKSLS